MDSTATIQILTNRVRHTYGRSRRRDWRSILRFLAACTLFSFFVVFVIDRLTELPAPVRVLLTLGILVGIWGRMLRRQRAQLPRCADAEQMAREVERRARRVRPGGLQSMVVSATEFGLLGRTPGSAELREQAIKRAAGDEFDPTRWKLHRKDSEIRSWKLFASTLGLYLLWYLVSPASMSIFFSRAIGLSVPYPTRTVITSVSAPETVPRYEDVHFVVEAEGVLPAQGVLKVSHGRGRSFELILNPNPEEPGRFEAVLERPTESFTFHPELGDARGAAGAVKVLVPPVLLSGELLLHSPPYLNRRPVRRPLSSFQIWKGGTFALTLQTQGEVERCILVLSGEEHELQSTENGFRIEGMQIDESTSFSIRLVGAGGVENPRRANFHITLLEDTPPVVEMLAPGQGGYLSPRSLIRWRFRARDDLGLRNAVLRATLIQPEVLGDEGEVLQPSRVLHVHDIPLGDFGGVPEIERAGELAADTLDLTPGMHLQLQAGVRDDAPNRAEDEGWSEAVTLQVVSAEELKRILAEELIGAHMMIQDIREDMEDQRTTLGLRIQNPEQERESP